LALPLPLSGASPSMPSAIESYLPLLVHLLVVVGAVGALLGLSLLLGPRRRTVPKALPYESGTQTSGSARQRFTVHFYLVAMLFILFDVEAVFLFAWSVAAKQLGRGGFATIAIFVLVLGLGLAYAWRKGALSWEPQER
jgi:NADH-quinone oxidoreductase subunit A